MLVTGGEPIYEALYNTNPSFSVLRIVYNLALPLQLFESLIFAFWCFKSGVKETATRLNDVDRSRNSKPESLEESR